MGLRFLILCNLRSTLNELFSKAWILHFETFLFHTKVASSWKKDPHFEPRLFHEKNLSYFEDKANILQMTFDFFFV